LLYPREDKDNHKLEFACRTCYYSEPAETTCIFRNELSNTVGDTAGITQDIGEDPTVGDYDLSEDPNADFYASSAHHSSSSSPLEGLPSAFDLPIDVPDFCTMCGQEVFCEICGQPSDRGCFLEVHEEQAAQFEGMRTSTSMTSSTTADMMESSQTQLQQLRLQHDKPGGGGNAGS
jgi:DNA-directed RNA polymerase II subunit RPB9